MKTIAYRDNAGGSIHCFKNRSTPHQKRHDRIKEALKDLEHTGNITIYLIRGNRIRKIGRHGM
jgi:hypothetical protein